ncbi:MAG: hypothetical protein K5752_02375 [Succinivibrionaceae bacterium]|nr:hypothetical protein [Succinivibrionaceae bacterium]
MKFKSIAISIILGCLNTCVFAVSNDCSNADDCYQKAVLLAPENELTSDSDEIFDIDYFSKAEKYLIKTCQMSHAESCLLLGLHYGEQPGNGGMVLNFAKSAMYLRKSCELKNDNGCASAINLFKYQGMCCEPDLTRGNGVHLCPEKCATDAVNFLDNLCDRNNKNACATAGYFIRNQYKGIN